MERIHQLALSVLKVLPTTLLIAISSGIAASFFLSSHRVAAKGRIATLSQQDLAKLVWDTVPVFTATSVAILSIFLAVIIWRRKTRHVPAEKTIAYINHLGWVVVTVPLFLLFEVSGFSKSHPFLAIMCSGTIAAMIGIWWYRLPSLPRVALPLSEKQITVVAVMLTTLFATLFALQMFQFQLSHHHSLKTGNYDLGVYVNTLWNSARGRLLESRIVTGGYHIFAHFDPILVLFSPVTHLDNDAWPVLLFQNVWLALGAFPVFLITRHHLKRNWMAVSMSVTYLLYPALHGMTLYEFHSLTLAGPMLLWAIYFIDTRRFAAYFVTLCIALMTREDISLIMFFVGMTIFLHHKCYKTGLFTMLLCLAYFITVKQTIMASDKAFSYDGYFSGIVLNGRSLLESLVITLFTDPFTLIQQGFSEHKVLYLLQLLVPLAMAPLFGKGRLLSCIYGLSITFLVTRGAVTDISYQYPTFLYPFFFAMTPAIIKELGQATWIERFHLKPQRLMSAIVIVIMSSTICMSWNFGAFRENEDFKAGHTRLVRSMGKEDKERYNSVKKLQQIVPDSATLSASESIGPHFATREVIYQFKKLKETDYYVLFDNDIQNRKMKKKYRKFLKKDSYQLIFEENGLKLFVHRKLPLPSLPEQFLAGAAGDRK
ncbi:MAG: DUF2079 domain-containing protein [Deltaproteobacteria bacterium]|nr:DUF2079 domain-containing protein [Deltaproteobacteria bacterium]